MFLKKVLYNSYGYDDYNTYRIPSLLITKKGTVITVCEGRKYSPRDWGEVHLLLRRSMDGGITFTPQEIIWMDGSNTCGNPCMVQDGETGRINLLCCKNNEKVFLLYSNDEGKTWSDPKEITKDVKESDWDWYATGPGIGIQTINGARLIIPCDHSRNEEVTGEKITYSHIIYSDNGGISWNLGGSADMGTDECQVVELSDGNLLLNMRSQYNRRGVNCTRQTAISKDGGLTWENQRYDNNLIEPTCQASIIRFESGGRLLFVFANPANKDERYNATVRISSDDCRTWEYDRCFYPERSAYTSIGVKKNGEILCMLECGTLTNRDKIVLFTFDEGWIKREDKLIENH